MISLAAGPRPVVSVVLVEPVPLVLEALRHLLDTDPAIAVVGTAPSVTTASLPTLRPDVVILDADELVRPLEESITACSLASPRSRVCVLSTRQSVRLMERALAADAAAYVVKDTSPERLVEIVHFLAAGEVYADPRLAGRLLRRKLVPSDDALTARENDVVRLVADGLSNREIGDRLAVSEKTIKNHVSHILLKLDLPARTSIAVFALRNGLVN